MTDFPSDARGQVKRHTNGRWYAERVVCFRDGAEVVDPLFDGPCMRFFDSETEAQTAAEDYARRFLTLACYLRAVKRSALGSS